MHDIYTIRSLVDPFQYPKRTMSGCYEVMLEVCVFGRYFVRIIELFALCKGGNFNIHIWACVFLAI